MPFRAAWLFMWEKTVNGRKTCAGLFPLSEQNKENVTKSFWKRKKYVKNFVPLPGIGFSAVRLRQQGEQQR